MSKIELHPKINYLKMENLTPGDKEIASKSVHGILDNLDEIQALIGIEEYAKQLSHWQGVLNAIIIKY